MRVSRQWRDIKVRKWFGYGHDTDKEPGNGDLAFFCPACPQPGINLPDNWRELPNPLVKWSCQCLLKVKSSQVVVSEKPRGGWKFYCGTYAHEESRR
jgi:hypothetical protein